jgi:hypothetical protein
VAVFQIAVVVESSVFSQDPPEADKSAGQKALEEAFEIAIEVAEDPSQDRGGTVRYWGWPRASTERRTGVAPRH